jgi:ABC-type transport system involved in multi-copper enzyme maturation permease subunit
MTAIVLETVRPTRVAAKRIPLSRVIAVELRKMFDTRSGFWLMASIVLASLVATGSVILFAPDKDLTYNNFAKAIGFPMVVILPIVALLSVTGEWSQRSGLTTFTLLPHRSRVILAKGISSVTVGVVSMLLAFAIGAAGNVIGTAISGTDLVWDISLADAAYIVLGNLLGLLTGFMLGVLIRNSSGAIVAYFVYSFVLTAAFGFLAHSQEGFRRLQPWVDVNFAQGALFNGSLTAAEWAHIGVTGAIWLVIPLMVGLFSVMRSEVK